MSLDVMLVDENPERGALVEHALLEEGYRVVARVANGAQLLSTLDRVKPDVIIVDMDCPDRDTLENLGCINRSRPYPVVMFSEDSTDDMIRAAINAGVSAYVVDGLNKRRIRPVLEVAMARFQAYQTLRNELDIAKTKLEERKLVDRAKGLLMDRRKMSESDAYSALRKLAMSKNLTLGEAAKKIIDVSEILV